MRMDDATLLSRRRVQSADLLSGRAAVVRRTGAGHIHAHFGTNPAVSDNKSNGRRSR